MASPSFRVAVSGCNLGLRSVIRMPKTSWRRKTLGDLFVMRFTLAAPFRERPARGDSNWWVYEFLETRDTT